MALAGDQHNQRAAASGAVRACVCVAPSGVEIPDALARAMQARGLAVEVVPTALDAFASVLGHGSGVLLLIIEPSRAPWADRVTRAVERYAPRASVWCWESSGSPQLRPLIATQKPAPQANAVPARAKPATNGDSALLRLVDTQNGSSHTQNGNGRGPSSGGGMLDADELAMLLGERARGAQGGGKA